MSKKTRTLREICDQHEDLALHSNFALFSYQPIYFDEFVKDKNCVKEMDEEIESIEKNDTCDLVDFPK